MTKASVPAGVFTRARFTLGLEDLGLLRSLFRFKPGLHSGCFTEMRVVTYAPTLKSIKLNS